MIVFDWLIDLFIFPGFYERILLLISSQLKRRLHTIKIQLQQDKIISREPQYLRVAVLFLEKLVFVSNSFFYAKQRTLQKERKETYSLSSHSSKTLILILMSFSCLGVSALKVSL